jgi:hypothetical protein
MTVALIARELLIAFLHAYVFTVLARHLPERRDLSETLTGANSTTHRLVTTPVL